MTMDLPFDVVELQPVAGGALPPLPAAPLAEMPFRRDAWLPQDIARLKALFASDTAVSDIAEALGRGVVAVRTKVWELGLRRHSARPWTDLDDEYLVQHYATLPTADVAALLARSCSAVYARAGKLGLTTGNPPRWSDWEVAQLRAGYGQGIPVAQLALLIGRPACSLASKASLLGIRHANDDPDWTDAERAECLRLAETGMLYSKIVGALADTGFPRRSKQAIDQYLMKAGYKRGWGRPWTAEEEDSLRAAYARNDSIRQWAFRNARTVSSVRWKAGDLGLQGTHANKQGFCGETWTEAELAVLRAEYGRTRTAELAKRFGRSHLAVCLRANVLGLEHGFMRPFSPDEDRAFHIAFHSRDITFGDLAAVMGRDVAVIGRHAKRLGLKFSERPYPPPRTPRKSRRTWTLVDILALDTPAPAEPDPPPAAVEAAPPVPRPAVQVPPASPDARLDARIRTAAAQGMEAAAICARYLLPYQRVARVLAALPHPSASGVRP